jgi:hypothetical protein
MECTCKVCGMGVKGLTCSKCNSALVEDTITTDSGKKVKVAKCPKKCGQIKSPMCCGHDMECTK